jgi:hypothetical protein
MSLPTKLPKAVRPIVLAARRTVREAAPDADEIPCAGAAPRSKRALWKIVRFAQDGAFVAGIGVFATHALLFFYRGKELRDRTGLLEGGGKQFRFVRLQTPRDPARPEVKRVVRQAFALNRRRGS